MAWSGELQVEYALSRCQAFLDEVSRLKESRFPYEHSAMALERMRALLREWKRRLRNLGPKSPTALVYKDVEECLGEIQLRLPLLGFIERSTNPRTAFEVYGPLLRLARTLLDGPSGESSDQLLLVLSSEWDYVPHIMGGVAGLDGFVFLGLPAHEAVNPMLTTLAGHELGHCLWYRRDCDTEWELRVTDEVAGALTQYWSDFQGEFREYKDRDADAVHMDAVVYTEFVYPAVHWALAQCREVFADFVGLLLFGRAYLRALAYLLSPGRKVPRSHRYPPIEDRAQYLYDMATACSWAMPHELGNYTGLYPFHERPLRDPRAAFLLSLADGARRSLTGHLWTSARRFVDESGAPTPNDALTAEARCLLRLEVPCGKPAGLADILNAAWDEAPTLSGRGKDAGKARRRADSLSELVLKSCEILEYEHRTKGP